MAASAGKLSSLVINGTTMKMVSGSVKENADNIDVTNTASNGFYECIAGILKLSINADCIWESDALPSGDPPNIVAGQQEAITFTLGSAKSFTGTIQFDDVSYNTEVKGAVKYSFSGVCTGSYTDPS